MSASRRLAVVTGFLARPAGWLVLLVVIVATLAIGSVHTPPLSQSARIGTLDNEIKCPECADVSIAQSEAQSAVDLRATVRSDVEKGWSNARIEAWVTARYGPGEILSPSSPVVWLLPLGAVVLAAGALAAALVRRRARRGSSTSSLEDEALVAKALAEH